MHGEKSKSRATSISGHWRACIRLGLLQDEEKITVWVWIDTIKNMATTKQHVGKITLFDLSSDLLGLVLHSPHLYRLHLQTGNCFRQQWRHQTLWHWSRQNGVFIWNNRHYSRHCRVLRVLSHWHSRQINHSVVRTFNSSKWFPYGRTKTTRLF